MSDTVSIAFQTLMGGRVRARRWPGAVGFGAFPLVRPRHPTGCPQGGPQEDRRREFAKYQELTGKLYRAGVPLLVGTDAPEPQVTPGFSLHQELEMLVESGLSPAAALPAATLHNAKALQQEKHLGTISPGKSADLVLLTANPLTDIRLTRQIEFVLRSGLIVRPQEILKLLPRE